MNLMCTIAKERMQRDYWEQQAKESVVQQETVEEANEKNPPTA
ncbi:hypothetical protein AB1L06_09735 [Bacillus mojavensis]